MKPLYNQDEFNLAKSRTKLPCECYHCKNVFYVTKNMINMTLNPNTPQKSMYCSKECSTDARINTNTFKTTNCANCGKSIIKLVSASKRHKNTFCSHSCSTTHHQLNKTSGNRRSKLETYIEKELILIYPTLEFHFNRKDTINSELDIYIPSLKLAFELNGIFHYEPIYGLNKLNQINNNDNRKFQACIEGGISLCIINTSGQKYFKESSSKQYLDIITKIINNSSQYVK